MTTTTTKDKTATQAGSQTKVGTGVDSLTRTSLIAMSVVSAVIGIWAVACFLGALVSSNGPLEIIQGWFTAFTGH